MSRRLAGRERGSVLVIVAGAMPVLVVLAVFAVDMANWFVHKRHLQTQADAAALAAINELHAVDCTPAVDNGVTNMAKIYAGMMVDPSTGQRYNVQVGDRQSNVFLAGNTGDKINQPTYYQQSNKPDPADSDLGSPCETKTVDVKLTETDLPWMFQIGFVKYLNARARAELKTRVISNAGITPVGVVDPTPTEARVWIVDEGKTGCGTAVTSSCVLRNADDPTGTTPATAVLKRGSDQNGLSMWTNDLGTLRPLFSKTASQRTSAVIALSSRKSKDLSADLTTACAQTLVVCYEQGTAAAPKGGLVFIQTYKPPASTATNADITEAVPPKEPIAREIRMTNPASAGCNDPDVSFSAPCGSGARKVDVTAKVDFGPDVAAPAGSDTKGRGLFATFSTTAGNNDAPNMEYKGNGVWSTTSPLTVPTGTGPAEIRFFWTISTPQADGVKISINGANAVTCTTGQNNNPCKNIALRDGDGGVAVQRTFTRGATSNPIELAQIGLNGSDVSFPRCRDDAAPEPACSPSLSVTIGVTAGLTNDEDITAPPTRLRGPTVGSTTGTVTCDPTQSSQPEEDLAKGCQRRYRVFTGQGSPWSGGCAGLVRQDFAAAAEPWQCAAVGTGATPPQIGAGINRRVFCGGAAFPQNGGTCTVPNTCPANRRNQWKDPNTGVLSGKISLSDPRVVALFVVPYGSFDDNKPIPVRDFGYFYITGWQGQGNQQSINPCQTPVPGDTLHDDDIVQSGEVVGHYFKALDPVNDGGGGSEQCDFDAFSGCVAVLTR